MLTSDDLRYIYIYMMTFTQYFYRNVILTFIPIKPVAMVTKFVLDTVIYIQCGPSNVAN